MKPLNRMARRTFLRATGISVALPFLDAMIPSAMGANPTAPPKRLICICTAFGLHAPFLFPTDAGRGYAPTPYLELLRDHRNDFTLFNGFAHPGNEAGGHKSEVTFLTAARNPQLPGFRNTISLDQFAADRLGLATRYSSLTLATTGSRACSLAVNRSGVNLPAESRPSAIFARLFLDGSPEEVRREELLLAEGRSVLDAVAEQAKRLAGQLGAADRDKLDEYFTSVREMEQRLQVMQAWSRKPKPKVNIPQPQDVQSTSDLIGRMDALFHLMPFALQTDSTRVISLFIGEAGGIPQIPGVTMGHHSLTHHGLEPGKLDQLRRIETAELKSFAGLLLQLKGVEEGGDSLLENTTVLFGSNLGSANNHSTSKLPIILAGGGFKHGQHLVVAPRDDPEQNKPLSNLFVTILQRMGMETERFGNSTGTVSGLEST